MNLESFARRAPLWSLLILPVAFGLSLALVAQDPRVWYQFDLDGTRRNLTGGFWFVLCWGLAFESGCALVLSALTWLFLRRPLRFWRALTLGGSVLSLAVLFGLVARLWRYDEAYPIPPAAYLVDVPVLLGLTLPILWALGLFLLAITARSRSV